MTLNDYIQGHSTFEDLYLVTELSLGMYITVAKKSFMHAPLSLTLGNLEGQSQGHSNFMGLIIYWQVS